jgi:RES domain-containing protein
VLPPTTQIDQRDTHRLIPAQYADGGVSVLTRLSDEGKLLDGIFELDNATNDRLLAESSRLPGVDARELIFGIPSYRIINAAFCHAAPKGSRFNSPDRGVWYASFELATSQAEAAYHRRLWLTEINWQQEDVSDYVDYLADFHAEFHDIRGVKEFSECCDPDSYQASQRLGKDLLELGSAGIVYPSARRPSGTCIGCFRPVLVTNVRRGRNFRFEFADCGSDPKIQFS